MTFEDKDYENAVKFALNYPTNIDNIFYDDEKDIYAVEYMDQHGRWTINLIGKLVRSILHWAGPEAWTLEEDTNDK